MNWWSDLILAFIAMTLHFYLALAFIGKTSGRKGIISIIILTLQAFFFRDYLPLPTPIYVLIFLVIFTLCLFLIQQIKFILSLLGTLLTNLTTILSNLLIIGPILQSSGIKIPLKPNGWEWLILALAELMVPFTIFILLKISKFSISRFMPDKES